MSAFLFETPRLRCRRWRADDLQPLFEVYSDADAMRFVGDGQPITCADCERWMQVTEANYAQRGYGMYTLEERSDDGTKDSSGRPVVGFCGLVHPGGQREAEVKYALRRSHWGRGLASEAVAALVAYGAAAHGLTHLIATVAPGNLASQRVLEKAGLAFTRVRDNEDGSQTHMHEWRAPPQAETFPMDPPHR